MLYLYIGLGVLALLLAGFLISIPVVSNICYKRFFLRGDNTVGEMTDAHYEEFKKDICAAKAQMEKLPFTELYCTAEDGVKLYAKYYDFGGAQTLICLHGMRSAPLNNFAVAALRFKEQGFNVLLPDQRAHGKSGGREITCGHRESEDLLEWIKLIKSRFNEKTVLYGISMGAATIGFASDKIEEGDVCAAVYDCGFTSVGNLIRLIKKKYHAPALTFKLLKSKCKRKLGIDLDESVAEHIKYSKIPSVFVHGLEDTAVPPEDSKENYNACTAPKELILVEGCGHTTAAIKGDAAQKIIRFVKKYL